MRTIAVRLLASAVAFALTAVSSSGLILAQDEPGSAGGIAVSPLVTPADAEGSFGFAALPEEILAGFSIGFGGFGGASFPGFDLETILDSPEMAEFGITVEANGTGLLPRATAPELSGRVLVLLHDVPSGFVVRGARCTDASGAVVAEVTGSEADGPMAVSVNALSNVGLACDFDVERLPDADLTLVAATIPTDAEGTFTFIDLPGAVEGIDGSLDDLSAFLALLQGEQPATGGLGGFGGLGSFGGAILASLQEELATLQAGLGGPWAIEANTPTAIGARPPGPHTIILSELEPGYAPQFVSCTAEGSAADTGPADPADLTPDLGPTFLGRPVPVLASGPGAITIDLPAGSAVTCTFSVAPGEPGSAGGIAVSPLVTPADAEGSFGFAALPEEILAGFSIGFGGFGGASFPGFDLETILDSPEMAEFGITVEANGTGLLPRATAPELSGRVLVLLHDVPSGFVVRGARCTDASGAVVAEVTGSEADGPMAVSVNALSNVGLACDFDVERLPDADLTLVAATIPTDAEGTFTFIDLPGAVEGIDGSLDDLSAFLALLQGEQPATGGLGGFGGLGSFGGAILASLQEELATLQAGLGGPWAIEANTPTAIGARPPGPHTIILSELEPGYAPQFVSCTAEGSAADTGPADPADLTPDLGPTFLGRPVPVLASGPGAITIDLPAGSAVTCTFSVAPGEPGSAGGIAVSPLVTPADAEGSFGFAALPEEILAGFSIGFGGFGGASFPGFDLETILDSPEMAEFGITVEANGTGLLPRATAPELSGRVLVLLHDVPSGFVVRGARCTDASGAVVAEVTGSEADGPMAVSVNALSNVGLACDFDVERLPDADLTLVAATIPTDAEGTFTFIDLPGAVEGIDGSLDDLSAFLALLQGEQPATGGLGGFGGLGSFGGAILASLQEELATLQAGLGGPWAIEANTPTAIGARPPGPHTIILSELEPGYAPQFVSCTAEGSAADTGPADPADLTPDLGPTFLGRPVPVLASGPGAITIDLPAGSAVTCTFSVAPGEPGSAGGIAVSPLVTPADAEGSFGFAALPEEILAGFSIGFGGFGGASFPGFDLETILDSPEMAEFGITVEANGTGLLPRATAPELSGRVLVLLHDVPSGFVVRGARCTDASGAVVAEVTGSEADGPMAVSVNALSNVGLACDFDVERLPDADLTLVAATIPTDAEGTFTFIDLPGAVEGIDGSLDDLSAFLALLQGEQPATGGLGGFGGLGSFGGAILASLQEELATLQAGLGGPWAIEANTPTAIGARPPGPHTIILSELEPGYAPQFVSCTAEGSAADTGPADPADLTPDLGPTFLGRPVPVLASGPGAITIDLPAGSAVTCTFSVAPGEPGSAGEDAGTALGAASIRVLTDPPGETATFEVEVDGRPVRIGPADPHRLKDPDAGPHTAMLTDALSDYELVEHECVTAAAGAPRPYRRVDDPPSLTFGLEEDDVVCTFTLRRTASTSNSEVLAPRAGRWRIVNQAASFSCAGITTPVARTTDNGRIALRRSGERIIATGFSNDDGRLVLDQVAGKPGRYAGTITVRAQGNTIRLRYQMRVLNPRRIEGEIRARTRVAGQACGFERGFQGRFRGN